MRIKQRLVVVLFIAHLLLIPVARVHCEVYWTSTDPEDDVGYYEGNNIQFSGDYADEIDVISLELIDSNAVLTLQEPPVQDFNHSYEVTILWNNYWAEPGYNSTFGAYGISNEVVTLLQNSTGHIIAEEREIYVVTTQGNQIVMPIPLYEQIPEPGNPDFIEIHTWNEIGNNQRYRDNANKTDFTVIYDPESEIIPTVSFSAIAIIGFIYLIRKKKK
ncbi:MAG: hypothetical protein ACTSXA_13935 [Candidatus Heimdallarchaeota archaeon]